MKYGENGQLSCSSPAASASFARLGGDLSYNFMIGSYKKYDIMSMTLNTFSEISIFHDFS